MLYFPPYSPVWQFTGLVIASNWKTWTCPFPPFQHKPTYILRPPPLVSSRPTNLLRPPLLLSLFSILIPTHLCTPPLHSLCLLPKPILFNLFPASRPSTNPFLYSLITFLHDLSSLPLWVLQLLPSLCPTPLLQLPLPILLTLSVKAPLPLYFIKLLLTSSLSLTPLPFPVTQLPFPPIRGPMECQP